LTDPAAAYAEISAFLAASAAGNFDAEAGMTLIARYSGNDCLDPNNMKATEADFMAAKTPQEKIDVMIKHQTCFQKILAYIEAAAAKAGVKLPPRPTVTGSVAAMGSMGSMGMSTPRSG
jgi:hypothetical protein